MSFPLFYVFDLALEGCAHGFGWWQYQYAFGPSMSIGTGHFPLLWPILEQVPFMALAAFALTWQNRHGEDLFEAGAHFVIRRKPNQLTILASWIITINVLVRGLDDPATDVLAVPRRAGEPDSAVVLRLANVRLLHPSAECGR